MKPDLAVAVDSSHVRGSPIHVPRRLDVKGFPQAITNKYRGLRSSRLGATGFLVSRAGAGVGIATAGSRCLFPSLQATYDSPSEGRYHEDQNDELATSQRRTQHQNQGTVHSKGRALLSLINGLWCLFLFEFSTRGVLTRFLPLASCA